MPPGYGPGVTGLSWSMIRNARSRFPSRHMRNAFCAEIVLEEAAMVPAQKRHGGAPHVSPNRWARLSGIARPPGSADLTLNLTLRLRIRRGGRGTGFEVVEHEQADRRRQISLLAVAVDFAHEFRQGHVPEPGNLLHAVPECLFEAHAGLVTRDNDRTFHHGRLHDASSLSILC